MEKSVFTPEYGLLLRQLRETRQERGITQAQLAERLHETQSWVSKCERGEHRLERHRTAEILCRDGGVLCGICPPVGRGIEVAQDRNPPQTYQDFPLHSVKTIRNLL